MTQCHFIPPYLLHRVASAHVDADVARCGHRTLAIDAQLRDRRTSAAAQAPVAAPDRTAWVVHSADNGSALPGRRVRVAGDPPSGDAAADEAYDGVEASLLLFAEELGRDSFDGRGATVLATVHFERDYDNAFWDGRQLVFGDGDGRVFDRFTKSVDVLAHEFSHGVVQYTAGLVYQDQPGALNEHVCDVFASCVKQRELDQRDPSGADWLIGESIFLPSVRGRALRSMAAPGTAYDDPVLGRDPQVGHMDDYVRTAEDNGGVHLNSGIPNRAFHLAATALGGPSWEEPARIWYSALDSGLRPDTDFATFARATVEAAGRVSDRAAGTVADAWSQAGVPTTRGAGSTAVTPLPGGRTDERVAVSRSGGFAGMTRRAEVRLGDDPRTPEVEELLTRIHPEQISPAAQQPDRFVYSFSLCGRQVTVSEQELTPELARLAHLLLDE